MGHVECAEWGDRRQPEAQGGEATSGADCPEQVEPAGLAGRLLEHQGRGLGRDKADRHVDDQRPAPRGVGGEQAADHKADGAGEGRDRGINAGGPAPLRALGEVGDDNGQGRRGDGVRVAGQGDRRQPQARGPPLGPLLQQRDPGLGQRDARGLQQLAGLLLGKAQVRRADLR